ncbi:MAG TPA: response regulator [Chloroflexota bacterium]|nr:response regulator [Chloroflexota bacterium]
MTPPGKRPHRILVVDDDPGIRGFLTGALEDEGYEVRVATNGSEALGVLTTLSDWVPDAILLDLYMPEMDGWTFRANQLALDGPAARIPVIVLTASRNLGGRGGELHATAVMEKPFELDALFARLEQMLNASSPGDPVGSSPGGPPADSHGGSPVDSHGGLPLTPPAG